MSISPLDIQRFRKVMALLDSALEGETQAALERARVMLQSSGMTFSDLTVCIGDEAEEVFEQQLDSLRWTVARQELQIAALRQTVERKSAQVREEQERHFSLEREVEGLRRALAVQGTVQELHGDLEVPSQQSEEEGLRRTSVRPTASASPALANGMAAHGKALPLVNGENIAVDAMEKIREAAEREMAQAAGGKCGSEESAEVSDHSTQQGEGSQNAGVDV